MTRTALKPDGLAVPKAPYSSVLVSGDLVFTAGQVAFDEQGALVSDDFAEQAHQVFRNVQACLEAAGCGWQDVVKTTCFLVDLGDFPAFNEIYRQYLVEPYPARSTVQAGLFGGCVVEVEAIARKPA